MGPIEGPAWARDEGIAALFLESGDRELRASWTPEMLRWLVDVPTPTAASTEEQPVSSITEGRRS